MDAPLNHRASDSDAFFSPTRAEKSASSLLIHTLKQLDLLRRNFPEPLEVWTVTMMAILLPSMASIIYKYILVCKIAVERETDDPHSRIAKVQSTISTRSLRYTPPTQVTPSLLLSACLPALLSALFL